MTTRSSAAIAATAFNKITTLRQHCAEEIAQAPESIQARYDEREQKVFAGLAVEPALLLRGMLRATYDTGAEPVGEEATPEEASAGTDTERQALPDGFRRGRPRT